MIFEEFFLTTILTELKFLKFILDIFEELSLTENEKKIVNKCYEKGFFSSKRGDFSLEKTSVKKKNSLKRKYLTKQRFFASNFFFDGVVQTRVQMERIKKLLKVKSKMKLKQKCLKKNQVIHKMCLTELKIYCSTAIKDTIFI